jgi:cell division septum initiation protein DivIVA
VVAHDQAHETTRRAQEQAERCVADAAANAVEITAEAKSRLRELDEETDSVWRERERLLEDTRAVSVRLASLVDEAESRFPADAGGERGTSDSPAVH